MCSCMMHGSLYDQEWMLYIAVTAACTVMERTPLGNNVQNTVWHHYHVIRIGV